MKKFIFLFFTVFIFWGCSDSPSGSTDNSACQNITCGDHGQCVALNNKPACVCETGYSNIDVAGVPSCVLQEEENKCGDTVCETWQECKEDKCETKEGFCVSDDDCTEQVCDLNSHLCKDKVVNPCENIDCSGHGSCVPSGDNAICICEPGYTAVGTTCVENDTTNPCENIDCSGHGSCVPSGDNAICICEPGYTAVGTTCVENNTDPCADVVCENTWEECKEGACVAKDGFCSTNGDCLGNKYCDESDHTCKLPANPCDGVICDDGNNTDLSHGQCVVSNGEPLCLCSNGYAITDDKIHCIVIDPCVNVSCENTWEECKEGACVAKDGFCSSNGDCLGNKYCDESDHTCKENQGSTVCEGVSCTDGVTEDSHGICFDANGVATCSCNQGYYRPNDAPETCLAMENLCANITCSGHGTCAVVEEQPVCACDEGYLVDGLNCIEDKCYGEDCSGHGTCVVTDGVASCECDENYKADGLNCYSSCFGDRDCDDDLYCNGSEVCGTDHFCKSGTPIDCHQDDDTYACLAAAYCDEGTDSCKYELPDVDDDNFADASCEDPNGITGTDCNDNDANINFGTTETCNFLDDNCDNIVDNGIVYSDGTDKRLTYGDSNSGCDASDTYGTDQCDRPNYSIIWSKNEFIAIWVDQRDGSDQIYMARYNISGDQTSGTEYQITASGNTAGKTIGKFAIAADSTDEKYIIVWRESGRYLKRVFINRYGNKLSQPVTVYDRGNNSYFIDQEPSVTWVDNKFAISFLRNNYSGENSDYRYARLAIVSNDTASTTNLVSKEYPALGHTYSDYTQISFDGEYLIYVVEHDYNLKFYKINKDTGDIISGYPKTFVSGINRRTHYSFHQQKENGENVYFVATENTDNTIKVWKFNKRLEQLNVTNVAVASSRVYRQPSMVWTGNQYIITFHGLPDTSNTAVSNIYLARVDMLGNVSQQVEQVSQNSELNVYPMIVDRDKKFTLFWLGNTSENWEIYMDNITCSTSN